MYEMFPFGISCSAAIQAGMPKFASHHADILTDDSQTWTCGLSNDQICKDVQLDGRTCMMLFWLQEQAILSPAGQLAVKTEKGGNMEDCHFPSKLVRIR